MKGVDFGRTADDYARHRLGFPAETFERLARHGFELDGLRVLDLGTGTGQFARELARRGARVTGLDVAAPLLAKAREADAAAGLGGAYVEGRAEETGLPDGAFDAATAAQCWHWFDGPRVLRELRRVLAPGGRAAILHLDWLPLPGNVVEATERLVVAHNPAWDLGGGDGRYPHEVEEVRAAGFTGLDGFTFDVDLPYTHEAWRGRIRASAGVSATLAPDAVERFDAEHARLLAARFPGDPLAVPHRVSCALGRAPCAATRPTRPPPPPPRRPRRG